MAVTAPRPSPLPPAPAAILVALVNDPAGVAEAYRWARRHHPPFPAAASAVVCWRFLHLAGLGVPYAPEPEQQAFYLRKFGWRMVSAALPPRAGDLFARLTPDGQIDHLGIVAKIDPLNSRSFLAADSEMGESHRPYRHPVDTVAYWLRTG